MSTSPGRVEHTVDHGDRVIAVAWSPTDAWRVATGSVDGALRIIRADTGRVEHRVEHGARLSTVAWSPSGAQVRCR